MKRAASIKKSLFLILAVAVAGSACYAATAFASTDAASTSVVLSDVTVSENSSYVTDTYAGVLHLSVADSTVACASVDSKSRVVVTGITAGSTKVSYWYRTTWSSDWVSATLPVAVAAQSTTAATVDAASAGVVLPETSTILAAGSAYTPSGIKVSGVAKDASSLLWVSNADSVASVNKTTGVVTAYSSGTAVIYAIDPTTKTCASLTVTVT